eukprot:gene42812-17592_t
MLGGKGLKLYNALELPRCNATPDQIKKAHHKLALKYHPDRAGTSREASELKFKEVQNAYDILKDPSKRKMYDLLGDQMFDNPAAAMMADAAGMMIAALL